MKIKITKIKKIEEIEFNDYLYDLTTSANHNFIANNLIVHNCEGTPGKTLLETGRYINESIDVEVDMPVRKLDFSSHLGRTDLFQFINKLNPEKIFCVHGEHTEEFARELKEKGYSAVAPIANDRIFQI